MSKLVKDLVTQQLKRELDGVQDLLLVNVIGLSAERTTALRKTLREKNIKLLVVKNSLARRATEGTALASAFDAMLAKEQAYEFLKVALEALEGRPDLIKPEYVEAARNMARNRLCAFEDLTARWLRLLSAKHGSSPILSAMQVEMEAFRRREAERTAAYWLE